MSKKHKRSIFFIKIIISYFILLFVVISVFMFVLYKAAAADNMNTAMKNQQELANKTAQQIDAFIDETNQIAQQVARTPSILNFFYKLQADNNLDNHFKKDILNQLEMSSALYTINGPKSSAYRVSVYNQFGDFVYTGRFVQKENKLAEHLNLSEVYSKMINLSYSDEAFIEVLEEDWGGVGYDRYIALYCPLMNVYSKEPCGVIEVQRDIRQLEKLLKFDTLDEMDVEIYDRNNIRVYPQEKSGNETEKYETVAYSEESGWRIVLRQPKSQLTDNSISLIIIFLVMYASLMMLAFIISYAIAQRITKPITELSNSVNKIGIGDMDLGIENDDQIDEIEELNEAFSAMIDRVTKSVEHEKTAYSMAMQAQMNPHFLYNTLSVISAAGIEAKSDKVVDMCLRLSEMLRYVASFEASLVSISDEIAHTKNYLALMKDRYEDYFEYSINVDEELYSVKVPKLIIQPLAENAFTHAFAEIEPVWKLEINVYEEDGYWFINVRDNGSGITDERIEEIKNKVEGVYKPFEQESLSIGGLGLIGTIIRLRLMLNENIGYRIERNNDRGTSVTFYGRI